MQQKTKLIVILLILPTSELKFIVGKSLSSDVGEELGESLSVLSFAASVRPFRGESFGTSFKEVTGPLFLFVFLVSCAARNLKDSKKVVEGIVISRNIKIIKKI